MSRLPSLLLLAATAFAAPQQLPNADEIRVVELATVAQKFQDSVWPEWSQAPFAILLVTADTEFLIHHPQKPEGFDDAGPSALLHSPIYKRPRKFPIRLLATFPALGDMVPIIVIGEPQATASKTSTPWLMTVMHEHFHQLQNSQPGYYSDVEKLGLAKGDTTGMWMLNYPFPYERKDLNEKFERLKALLLDALNTPPPQAVKFFHRPSHDSQFKQKADDYVRARREFFASLSDDDRKYLSFQLWQEGIARYTEIKVAQAVADGGYQPSNNYKNLADYSAFPAYAVKFKADTLKELSNANLAKLQRLVVYSWGAAEGMLLDRRDPKWHRKYFKEKFSLDFGF